LAPDVPTLAERLREHDFGSAGFVGNWVLRRGSGAERGFGTYTEHFSRAEGNRALRENSAVEVTDQAIAWLESARPSQRLFLWVHYQEPHGPYTPPGFEAHGSAENGVVLPRSSTQSGKGAIPRYQWLGHGRLAEYMTRYEGEVAVVDGQVGRLIGVLRESGLLDRSVVVFVADHGEAFGEDGLYCAHGEGLDDVLVRVPLMLRIPGQPPGVRHDAVRLIDVVPTLLESLGLMPAEGGAALAGRSLRVDVGQRPVVSQLHRADGHGWRSVREGDLELRESRVGSDSVRRLLRAGVDLPPAEATGALRRLGAILEQQAPWVEPPRRSGGSGLSQREAEALRSLGYLE
jgi:arylsulfatase A-like enzyme